MRVGGVFADGLPGEYLLSNQWRNLFAYYSPLDNPAFMTQRNYTSLRGVVCIAPDEVAQLWETGVVVPIGLYQSVGLSWIAENGHEISDGSFVGGEYVASDGTRRNHNSLFLGSYAINPWRGLSVGGNAAVFHQSGFGDPSQSIGIDAGAAYRLLRHPLLGFHLVGVTAQNLFTQKTSDLLERNNAAQLKMTSHSTWLENRVTLDCQVDITDILAASSDFAEDAASTEWDLTGQAGAWILRLFQINAYFGLGDDNLEFWGLAVGMNAPSVNAGRDFSVIYQFRDERSSDLRASHSLYVRADVGLHREEAYARRMARRLGLSPNDLYNKAMHLYHEKNFWDAYLLFARILAEYPDFFKNDWVNFYMGACVEGMDMREGALERYQRTVEEYPASETEPYAKLGMMRVHYRNDDREEVASRFRELIMPSVPDSLKFHAMYLMGQVHMRNKDFVQAIQFLGAVPELHPDYAFAQHTMAVAYIRLNNDVGKTKLHLENCAVSTPRSPAHQEIINRTFLLFGYLFYEESALAKAVTALRKIPRESYYYEDAQLGLGWAGIRAAQWADCSEAGERLVDATDKEVLRAEGLLLQGCGKMMQGEYGEATELLNSSLEVLTRHMEARRDSAELKRNRYFNDRITYNTVFEALAVLGVKGESETKQAMSDSLHRRQKEVKGAIDDYLVFSDEHERRSFFGRNAEALKADIEYVLATAQRRKEEAASGGVVDKQLRKSREIDEEIEELKQELEELPEK